MAAKAEDDLRRPHELAPVVRAAGQPTEEILGADNGQGKGPGGAVQRGSAESAPWLHQSADTSQENGGIGDVLDDLEGQYDVEALAGVGDRFGGVDSVIDRKTARLGVVPRDRNCFCVRVDSGYPEPEARHWLGDQASATTDVEQGEPLERSQRGGIATEMRHQMLTNKAESSGVEPVQWPETAFGVPPGLCLRSEAFDLLRVDRGARLAQASDPLGSTTRFYSPIARKRVWDDARDPATWLLPRPAARTFSPALAGQFLGGAWRALFRSSAARRSLMSSGSKMLRDASNAKSTPATRWLSLSRRWQGRRTS